MPDKCVKFAALGNTAALNQANCGPGYPLGLDYRVLVTRDNGQSAYIPVRDVGPWNTDDNYWDPADSTYPRPRRLFGGLPRGTPESEAAFYNGYNTVSNCKNLDGSFSNHAGAADQFGRCVLNPAGIDLSTQAKAQLGIPGNEWVWASYVWDPLEGILAFPYGFHGGAFTAAGEFNGDSTSQVVAGADAGGGPAVEVFRADGVNIGGFWAFPTGFRGGVRVATGHVEPPATTDDIVTGAGPGGGAVVEVFRLDGTNVGGFLAYSSAFRGGLYVASGNVDGVAGDEIVTGAGSGGGPHVRIFKPDGTPLGGFMAYDPAFTGGARVAVGDVNGDGVDEIITGAGPGGGPHVRIFKLDGTPLGGFMAYGPGFTGGVYVGTVRSPDGKTDWIVTGAGEGGGPHVRIFDMNGNVKGSFGLTTTGETGVRPAGGHFGSAPGDLAVSAGPGTPPLIRFRHLDGSIFFP